MKGLIELFRSITALVVLSAVLLASVPAGRIASAILSVN